MNTELNFFANHPIINQLPNKELASLAQLFSKKIDLEKNDYLFKEGETANTLAIILSGMVRYFYNSEDGEEVTRWVSLEGEFVTSISSFINNSPSFENIQAIKPTSLLIVKKEEWLQFCKVNPFARELWTKSIEAYIIGMESRVYGLIALKAPLRYEKLRTEFPKLIAAVPDKYLASILGIKPRHLSRLRNDTI